MPVVSAQIDPASDSISPSFSPDAVTKRPRIAALDAARAVGVVAMVVGHTLDAVLAASIRGHPALVLYWKARGFTAPIFMMAAGWSLAVAVDRGGSGGLAMVRKQLPRVLLLLAIGYFLRWPGWATDELSAGVPATRAHFLAFDALHVIAVSIVATCLLLGLRWSRKARAIVLGIAALAATAAGTTAPALPLTVDPASLPPSLTGMALAQALGGSSPFPLFPWTAFFFAGAIVGLLAGEGGRRAARAMVLAGLGLVIVTCWSGPGELPVGSPVLVAFRIGVVLLVLAMLSALPESAATRLAPLGRASLAVYAIHVPVVYGWSVVSGLGQIVGPVLPISGAIALALAVLAGSLALGSGLGAVGGVARRGWERRAVAGAALLAALRGLGGHA